ncbi:DUF4362 domain-containing protein [Bacillus sp. AK031]
MKRILILILIVMLSLWTAGCQSNENTSQDTIGDWNVPEYEQAAEDIVYSNDGVKNEDRFFAFLENVNQGIKDTIRVVTYTEEGDPILQDLEYDGDKISYKLDTRRDKFGSGEIQTAACQSIEVEEKPIRKDYILSGCNVSDIDTLIWVVKK